MSDNEPSKCIECGRESDLPFPEGVCLECLAKGVITKLKIPADGIPVPLNPDGLRYRIEKADLPPELAKWAEEHEREVKGRIAEEGLDKPNLTPDQLAKLSGILFSATIDFARKYMGSRIEGEPASFPMVQALEMVPQDPDLYQITREFIGADLTERNLVKEEKISGGRTLRTYIKDYGSHRHIYTWIFPAEMEVEKIPAIGEEVFCVFCALTAFAYQQKTISPLVQFRELQRWIRPGSDPVGWRKAAYENYLKSLAGLTLERQTKIKGTWKTEQIEHLLDVEFIRSGEKGEVITAIRATLAPRAMERLLKTLAGGGGRYITPSRASLTGRGLENYSRDLRKALRQLETYKKFRGIVTIGYKKLFTHPKWLGWDKAKMAKARPGDLLKLHRELVKVITDLELGRYRMVYPPLPPGADAMGNVGTILLWKMEFTPSDMGKLRQIGRDEMEIKGEIDLTDRLTDWNIAGGVKKDRGDLRTQIENVIRRYGMREVTRIWRESVKPRDFWNRIKAIKRQRRAAPDGGRGRPAAE